MASSGQPGVSDCNRAQAASKARMRFVISRFVPKSPRLHSTTRVTATDPDGDDGGNGVKLESPANLHTFWDDVLGGGDSPSTALNGISTLPSAPATTVDDLNVGHWINESFDAAMQTAYKNPPVGAGTGPFTLTQAYKTAARSLAAKRISLAGARLAQILNDELK